MARSVLAAGATAVIHSRSHAGEVFEHPVEVGLIVEPVAERAEGHGHIRSARHFIQHVLQLYQLEVFFRGRHKRATSHNYASTAKSAINKR